MQQALAQFLANYINASPGELQLVASRFRERRVDKHDFLLRAGEVCREFVFVETGCLRIYRLLEEREVTVWFAFAHNLGSEIQSFISGTPSAFFVEAIEPTTVWALPKQEVEHLAALQPSWQRGLRRLWEETIVHLIDRLVAFQHESAEQRYRALLQDPDYLQQIPQMYLASYLGITPSSLSRLRRQIR